MNLLTFANLCIAAVLIGLAVHAGSFLRTYARQSRMVRRDKCVGMDQYKAERQARLAARRLELDAALGVIPAGRRDSHDLAFDDRRRG